MTDIELLLALLGVVAGVVWFAGRIGVPYPIFLLLVGALERRFGADLRFAYRHFPLPDQHPHAAHPAEAAEAAEAQGNFWALHDRLFERSEELTDADLAAHAAAVGLDPERVTADLASGVHAERVREDVARALAAGIRGTPSFVVGGVRHHGFYDLETLSEALEFG